MAIQELFYDDEYEYGMFKYADKSRLLRCVDHKSERLFWEWQVDTTITGLSKAGALFILAEAYDALGLKPDEAASELVQQKANEIATKLIAESGAINSESGYVDFTPWGRLQILRHLLPAHAAAGRALKKVVKLK